MRKYLKTIAFMLLIWLPVGVLVLLARDWSISTIDLVVDVMLFLILYDYLKLAKSNDKLQDDYDTLLNIYKSDQQELEKLKKEKQEEK